MTKIKVKKLPVDPGPPAWNAILPPSAPYPTLEASMTADWLVIGAGFAGLSAARRLAQLRPEDQIVILEARRVAEGPAGRNSGVMVDLPHNLASEDYGGAAEADRETTRHNREAIAFAADMANDFEMPEEAFRPIGKTNAAASEKGLKHNQDFAAHLAKIGEPSENLDAAQMRDLTGSTYYVGGLYTPGAAILQPAIYIRGVASGVTRSNRVQLFEQSPVTALERSGNTWTAQTPHGSISAPSVILAVNSHVQSFGFFTGRLMHIFTYGSMTRTLSEEECARLGGAEHWAVTPADPLGTTVRRISGQGGNRIVVRNRFTYEPSMEVSEAKLQRVFRDHDRSFAARFPMLKGVEMEHRWGGRLCLSYNDVPAFGEVDDGLYSAACQNGLGTTKGTLSGMMAAELAAGHTSTTLDELQAKASPSRLPPEPIAKIGATARIRYGELKAGREL